MERQTRAPIAQRRHTILQTHRLNEPLHHLAIALLIATLLKIDVPLELGLAYSTEAYRSRSS